MPVTPHATKQDYELAFKGFHYPISKAAIINMGRDKGGIDREVAPNRRYANIDELKDAVRAVYRDKGVTDDNQPV